MITQFCKDSFGDDGVFADFGGHSYPHASANRKADNGRAEARGRVQIH